MDYGWSNNFVISQYFNRLIGCAMRVTMSLFIILGTLAIATQNTTDVSTHWVKPSTADNGDNIEGFDRRIWMIEYQLNEVKSGQQQQQNFILDGIHFKEKLIQERAELEKIYQNAANQKEIMSSLVSHVKEMVSQQEAEIDRWHIWIGVLLSLISLFFIGVGLWVGFYVKEEYNRSKDLRGEMEKMRDEGKKLLEESEKNASSIKNYNIDSLKLGYNNEDVKELKLENSNLYENSKLRELDMKQKQTVKDILKTDEAFIALFALGRESIYKEKWDVAADVFRKCVIHKPDDVDSLLYACYAITNLSEEIKDKEKKMRYLHEAKDLLSKARSLDKNDCGGQECLMWSYLLQKQANIEEDIINKKNLLHESMDKCNRALAINPNSSSAFMQKGDILFDQFKIKEKGKGSIKILKKSCEAFKSAIDCDGECDMAWNGWGFTLSHVIFLEEDDNRKISLCEEVLQKHERALEINPNNLFAQTNWIWSKIRRSELDCNKEEKLRLLEEVEKELQKMIGANDKKKLGIVFSHWAWKLICEGEIVESVQMKKNLFLSAIEKCKESMRYKPDCMGALKNWSLALNNLSCLVKEESQKETLLRESLEKCKIAEEFKKNGILVSSRLYYEWWRALVGLVELEKDMKNKKILESEVERILIESKKAVTE